MVEVRALFVGDDYRTEVWISDSAAKAIKNYAGTKENPRGALLKKIKRYSLNGFRAWERRDGPITHEWDGVFRIGHRSSLFRVIGFYGGSKRSEFIIADAYLKRGQQLSAPDRDRIDAFARIRKEKLWRKVDDD